MTAAAEHKGNLAGLWFTNATCLSVTSRTERSKRVPKRLDSPSFHNTFLFSPFYANERRRCVGRHVLPMPGAAEPRYGGKQDKVQSLIHYCGQEKHACNPCRRHVDCERQLQAGAQKDGIARGKEGDSAGDDLHGEEREPDVDSDAGEHDRPLDDLQDTQHRVSPEVYTCDESQATRRQLEQDTPKAGDEQCNDPHKHRYREDRRGM